MSIYYTYLVRHKPTNKFYYGVKYSKGSDPSSFWKTYFTSSKKIKTLIQEYGKDSFEFEIRKTFNSAHEAIEWENKVLRRMKVLQKQHIWLNMHAGKAIIYETHPRGMLGKKHSRETLEKRKHRRGTEHHQYGKSFPENVLKLALEARKGIAPWNKGKKGVQKGKFGIDNHNFGKPAYNRGIPMSEEQKQKLRGAKAKIQCPHCNKFGGGGAMTRYHFDNCKVRKLYYERVGSNPLV